jgi:hypothetical protein
VTNEVVHHDSGRLRFLVRIVQKEVEHLVATTDSLFGSHTPIEPAVLQQWIGDLVLSERLDAFVSRFSRLQDTLGDKLLPNLLIAVGESRGPAVDNLDKAEKFGWLASADDWMVMRRLRNQMVHEYIEDVAVLAEALNAGIAFVPALVAAGERMIYEVNARLNAG